MQIGPEIFLQVFEVAGWADRYCLDFNSLEPDSPATELLLQLFAHALADSRTIKEDFTQIGVCNLVPDNALTNSPDITVGVTPFNIFVTPKRAVSLSKDCPDSESCDLNALHLFGDVIGLEIDSIQTGGEFHYSTSTRSDSF